MKWRIKPVWFLSSQKMTWTDSKHQRISSESAHMRHVSYRGNSFLSARTPFFATWNQTQIVVETGPLQNNMEWFKTSANQHTCSFCPCTATPYPKKLLSEFTDFTIGSLAQWWQQLGDSIWNFGSYRVGTFSKSTDLKTWLRKKVPTLKIIVLELLFQILQISTLIQKKCHLKKISGRTHFFRVPHISNLIQKKHYEL